MSDLFNARSLTISQQPASEPVSLADLKTFLRVSGTDDDTVLNLFIAAARKVAEDYTRRAFITQRWKLVLDYFPTNLRTGLYTGFSSDSLGSAINLFRKPIQSIVSVTTYNPANTSAVLSSSNYTLDIGNARLLLNQGYAWPTDLREAAAIEIVFECGYGSSSSNVPAPIQTAIMLHAGALYETRGACDEMSTAVKCMLDPFVVPLVRSAGE